MSPLLATLGTLGTLGVCAAEGRALLGGRPETGRLPPQGESGGFAQLAARSSLRAKGFAASADPSRVGLLARRCSRPLAIVLTVLAAGVAHATDAAEAPGTAAPAPEAFASLPEVRGAWRSVLVEPGDTLLDIAYRERLGFEVVQRLNPDVEPWIPVPGRVVRLPTRYLPPAAPPRRSRGTPERHRYRRCRACAAARPTQR